MERLIGKKAFIIAENHPWYGEIGKVKEIRTTAFGKRGYVMDLENGISCFVFNPKELQVL